MIHYTTPPRTSLERTLAPSAEGFALLEAYRAWQGGNKAAEALFIEVLREAGARGFCLSSQFSAFLANGTASTHTAILATIAAGAVSDCTRQRINDFFNHLKG